METKSINFELKDLDKQKRTAVIGHATYDSVDRTEDISRKGMFTKSWKENKDDISFYLNHNDTQAPGKVVDLFEDSNHAYTKAWLGTHTLGNDTLIMMDEGVIKKASFGYITIKSNPLTLDGRRVRELKEVAHIETSVLTKMPAHPGSGVISVTKSFYPVDLKTLSDTEQSVLKRILGNDQSTLEELIRMSAALDPSSDLYTWVSWNISRRADAMGGIRDQLKWNVKEMNELRGHIKIMEKFCRDTKASDDSIKLILNQIEEGKALLTQAGEPLEPKRDWSQLTTLLN
jgi:HK97 family phage prohead protease